MRKNKYLFFYDKRLLCYLISILVLYILSMNMFSSMAGIVVDLEYIDIVIQLMRAIYFITYMIIIIIIIRTTVYLETNDIEIKIGLLKTIKIESISSISYNDDKLRVKYNHQNDYRYHDIKLLNYKDSKSKYKAFIDAIINSDKINSNVKAELSDSEVYEWIPRLETNVINILVKIIVVFATVNSYFVMISELMGLVNEGYFDLIKTICVGIIAVTNTIFFIRYKKSFFDNNHILMKCLWMIFIFTTISNYSKYLDSAIDVISYKYYSGIWENLWSIVTNVLRVLIAQCFLLKKEKLFKNRN